MFAVRGGAVCLSIFFLVYVSLSVAACGSWRILWALGRRYSACRCADLLFALRLSPTVIAGAITVLFAAPSFLLLEPRAANESISAVVMVLSFCAAGIVLTALWNALTALTCAWRTVSSWSVGASAIGSIRVNSKRPVAMLRSSPDAPALAAAGVLRATVWLSRAAESVLSQQELQSALRHEAVHVQRHDNLRKLILRLVPFPGMSELESAWREATEMAADDAAVSSSSEALDLAAAVIKLSRMASVEPLPELTMALVHSPGEQVNARVERLLAWTERKPTRAGKYFLPFALCSAAGVLTILAMTYSGLLVQVHAATEFLVR